MNTSLLVIVAVMVLFVTLRVAHLAIGQKKEVANERPGAKVESKTRTTKFDARTTAPGSHRRAKMVPTVISHRRLARYETERGGWSYAKVVGLIGESHVLLRRCGTTFVRQLA